MRNIALSLFSLCLLFASIPKLVGVFVGGIDISNGVPAALAAFFGVLAIALGRVSFDRDALKVCAPIIAFFLIIALSITLNSVAADFAFSYASTSIVSHALLPLVAVLLAAALPAPRSACGTEMVGLSPGVVFLILLMFATISFLQVVFISYDSQLGAALRDTGFLSWSGFFRIGDRVLTRGFAVYQVPVIAGFVVVLLAVLANGQERNRLLRAATLICALLVVCATLTRNAYLCGAVTLTFYLLAPRGIGVLRIVQLAMVVALIGTVLFLALGADTASSASLLSTGSTAVRLSSWVRIFGYIYGSGGILRYLFGFGITQVGENNPLNLVESFDFAIDNAYVLVFLCGGAVSLVCAILFYSTVQRELYLRMAEQPRHLRAGARGIFALWSAFPVIAMFNGIIGMFQFFPLFLLVVVRAIRNRRREAR